MPREVIVYRAPHEPTEAQKRSGKYHKREVSWHGLTIRVENEPGTVRVGVDRNGKRWQTRMIYAYGYVERTEGVDGDEVDIYLGPDPAASSVYVVHQRKAGEWDRFDEDKVMADFSSEDDARAAYLRHYNDPRFLGPITAMPVDEFVAKVRATRTTPAMIKAMPSVGDRVEFASDRFTDKGPATGEVSSVKPTADGYYITVQFGDNQQQFSWEDIRSRSRQAREGLWMVKSVASVVLLLKSFVRPHRRHDKFGRIINVTAYSNSKRSAGPFKDGRQLVLFPKHAPPAPPFTPEVSQHPEEHTVDMFTGKTKAEEKTKKYYVTMIRNPGPNQKVAWLAGPFDTHEEAKGHVDRARTAASKVDPYSDFDAFGTASREAETHPPGRLNRELGIGLPPPAKS